MIFAMIAAGDGSAGTIWGPCTGSSSPDGECDCPQCTHAAKLEAEGKCCFEEYEKARLRNFDKEGDDE